jgi:hypothetical protein
MGSNTHQPASKHRVTQEKTTQRQYHMDALSGRAPNMAISSVVKLIVYVDAKTVGSIRT